MTTDNYTPSTAGSETPSSHSSPRISVIIPAFNEEDSIGKVLADIPQDLVIEVVVVDNGSTDRTAEVAAQAGARVVPEPQRGYGSACLRGIAEVESPDVVVFLDADYSDHPEEMRRLVDPILSEEADMVIGSRMLGNRESGALLPQAYFGNKLAVSLMRLFFGARHTDLGPFRAIRWTALERLRMRDRNFGWTVEMQVKAKLRGLKVMEVPVSYRKRIGVSKITGTVSGSIKAGAKILYTIFKYRFFSS